MSAFSYAELRGCGLGADDTKVAGAASGVVGEVGTDYIGSIGKIITGIVGPLADAGASAYSTYALQDLAKKDQKARQVEMAALLAERQKEAQIEDARARMELQLKYSRAAPTPWLKYVAIGGAVLGGGLLLAKLGRRRG